MHLIEYLSVFDRKPEAMTQQHIKHIQIFCFPIYPVSEPVSERWTINYFILPYPHLKTFFSFKSN